MKDNADKEIKIYVRAKTHRELQELSKKTGISMSKLAWIALSNGYPKMRATVLKWQVQKELPSDETK